jgi:hyaluronan synthase
LVYFSELIASVLGSSITYIGLYGARFLFVYLTLLCCAIINRFNVDRMVNNLAREIAFAHAMGNYEKGLTGISSSALLNPGGELSIAVVGYREDEHS